MLSASVGIAQASDAGLDIDLLLQRSDQALYRAKNGGKNRYCVQGKELCGDKGKEPVI